MFGKAFAKYLSISFFDIDDLIVSNYSNKLYSSAREVFQAVGEKEFASLEVQALLALPPNHSIIALGGGTIMHQEAFDIIKNKGTLVYLSLPITDIYKRLLQRGLPARFEKAASVKEVLQQRINRMQCIADYHFPLNHVNLLDEHSLSSACESLNTLLNL